MMRFFQSSRESSRESSADPSTLLTVNQHDTFAVQLSHAQFDNTRHSFVLPEAADMHRATTVTSSPDLSYELQEPYSPIEQSPQSSSHSRSVDEPADQTIPVSSRSAVVQRIMAVSPLWNFVLTQPTSCLRSLLSFHNYAIITYSCLIIHFAMIYLSGFFLFMSFAYDSKPDDASESDGYHRTPECAGYEILLAFYGIRSLVMFAMYAIRVRAPILWKPRPNIASKVYYHIMHALTACTIFSFLIGVLLYTLIAPPKDCPSVIAHSGVILFFIIRDFFTLSVSGGIIGWLLYTRPSAQISLHIPYMPFHIRQRQRRTNSGPQMTSEAIKALPCRAFDSQNDDESTCAICLCDLVDGDAMRELVCNHGFHVDCLDAWLSKRASCPLCVRVVSAIQTQSTIEIPELAL